MFRTLTPTETDMISGGIDQVPLSGSNSNRQSGFATGASENALDGLSNAMQNIFARSPNEDVSANFETKPPVGLR